MGTAALAGWQLLIGGLPVAIGAILLDRGFDPLAPSATAWAAAIYAALIPMIFCHWAWFKVVAIYPAAVAAIGTLAIPVLGVLSSALWLGEPIGVDVVLSLCLVLAGLALVLILPAWWARRDR
jgi:drug/metabolite transporter (DMT)-like permease